MTGLYDQPTDDHVGLERCEHENTHAHLEPVRGEVYIVCDDCHEPLCQASVWKEICEQCRGQGYEFENADSGSHRVTCSDCGGAGVL